MLMKLVDMRVTFDVAEQATYLWEDYDDEYHGQTAAVHNVYITADAGNTGVIYLGAWKVSATAGSESGRPLRKGEQAFYKYLCLKDTYGVAATAGDALLISYETPQSTQGSR